MTAINRTHRRQSIAVIGAAALAVAMIPALPSTARAQQDVDFQVYCREKFPNSGYERRAEQWGVMHYCRRPGATGGFTLQPIDLADACERAFATRQYEVSGDAVACGGGGATAAAPSRPAPGPGPQRGPRPGPSPGPIPGPGPGPEPGPFPEPLSPPEDPGGPDLAGTAEADGLTDAGARVAQHSQFIMARTCSTLGGQWRSGTLQLVNDVLSDTERTIAERYADFLEETKGSSWRSQSRGAEILEGHRTRISRMALNTAYSKILGIRACHVALVHQQLKQQSKDVRTARQEGCKIEETLFDLWEAIRETMLPAHREHIWSHDWRIDLIRTHGGDVAVLCDKPVVRFVEEARGGFEEIEGDLGFYGGPVFLEVDYEKEQEQMDSFLTSLEWDEVEQGATARTEILLTRTPEDATLYRSGPINIEPRTPIADGTPAIPTRELQSPVIRP